MAGKAAALSSHPDSRRLATVVYLEAKAIDDALELFDLLMVTELLGKAERASDQEKARRHPRRARASVALAAAVEVLLEAAGRDEPVSLADVWASIDGVVPCDQLRAAVAEIGDLVPAADTDPDAEIHAALATRIVTVGGFLRLMPSDGVGP